MHGVDGGPSSAEKDEGHHDKHRELSHLHDGMRGSRYEKPDPGDGKGVEEAKEYKGQKGAVDGYIKDSKEYKSHTDDDTSHDDGDLARGFGQND